MVEIKYSISKNEVMHFYKKRWKDTLWKHHIFILACITFIAYNRLAYTQLTSFIKLVISLGIGFLFLSLMPLIPIIMHKKHERSMWITDEGIETIIAKKHKKIPWNKIAFAKEEDGYIYISGKNQNGFIIPTSAFNDTSDKSIFLNRIKEFIG